MTHLQQATERAKELLGNAHHCACASLTGSEPFGNIPPDDSKCDCEVSKVAQALLSERQAGREEQWEKDVEAVEKERTEELHRVHRQHVIACAECEHPTEYVGLGCALSALSQTDPKTKEV